MGEGEARSSVAKRSVKLIFVIGCMNKSSFCTMSTYEFTNYCTTKEQVKQTIERYGVAILPNVLDAEECTRLVSGIWDYFEHITQGWETPMNRNTPESWNQMFKFFPKHSMLFQHFGIGHAQVSWDMRQNEKILDIFSSLWNCAKEDLLVSFDGLSFHLPPEVTRRGWDLNHTWYHTDQSYTRNDLESIQSWVTGLDVNEGDATLAFLEGSNRFHRDFANHFKVTDKSDWYKLTEQEQEFYVQKGCLPKKIRCPKGSLVFWDSRTIHCGVEAQKGRKEANFRAIVYLCYIPRAVATDTNLKKKIKAFEELRTTNHYPQKPKLFSKVPRTYGSEMPTVTPISSPVLQPIGRRLIGYDA